MNKIFVHSKEITSAPGFSKQLEFEKLATKAFEQKYFQEMVLKALELVLRTMVLEIALGHAQWQIN